MARGPAGPRYYDDPDPFKIVYPKIHPPGFPGQLVSRAQSRMYPIHDHCAWVNRAGDGNTDVAASHFHRVIAGRVLPDESDGHTHYMTGLPCGAG